MPATAPLRNGLTQFSNNGTLEQFRSPVTNGVYANNGGFMETVGAAPDGSGNMMNKLKAMAPYFGVPQRQQEETPYSWWDTENYDLPDGLRGKCTYVLNILITAILTSDLTPVTEMLPYRKNEGSLTIQWDEWRFNDSLLDRTPEESVSRMTTNNMNSHTAHLVRRGKAFMLEHGFWMTPMGQKNWAMNIVQIVNATNETACYGSTHAVLTAPPYVDPNDRYRSQRDRSIHDIDRIVQDQTDSFARIQKEEGGYDTMIAKMDEVFENRNGHRANYLVLPAGCNQFIRNRPEENYFFLNGVGKTNRDVTKEGRKVVLSRGYRVGQHQPNEDPHYEVVAIGGFHVFNNQASKKVPIQEYHSRMRDIKIFDMSPDDYVYMEMEHFLGYCGLFDDYFSEKPTLSWIGQRFFSKYVTWGRLLDAAGEKQRVIDKIKLMDDVEFLDFTKTFNVPANTKYNGLFGDPRTSKKLGLKSDSDIVHSTQPTTAAQVSIDLKAGKNNQPKPLDIPTEPQKFIRDNLSGTVLSDDVLTFDGCTKIPLLVLDGVDSILFPGSANYIYDLSTRTQMLFGVEYSPETLKPSITWEREMTTECGGEHAKKVARAFLSVAMSVYYSYLTHYNKINSVPGSSVEKVDPVDKLITQFIGWLAGTKHCCPLFTNYNEKVPMFLSALFSPNEFLDVIEFQALPKLRHQRVGVSLDALAAFVVSASKAPDLKSLHSEFVRSAHALLPSSQTSTSGSVRDTLVRDWSNVAHMWDHVKSYGTAVGPMKKDLYSSDKKKLLTRELDSVMTKLKTDIDAHLVKYAGIATKDQKVWLEGFNVRWTILLPLFQQIWLLSHLGVTYLSGIGLLSTTYKTTTLASDYDFLWISYVGVLAAKIPNHEWAVKFTESTVRDLIEQQNSRTRESGVANVIEPTVLKVGIESAVGSTDRKNLLSELDTFFNGAEVGKRKKNVYLFPYGLNQPSVRAMYAHHPMSRLELTTKGDKLSKNLSAERTGSDKLDIGFLTEELQSLKNELISNGLPAVFFGDLEKVIQYKNPLSGSKPSHTNLTRYRADFHAVIADWVENKGPRKFILMVFYHIYYGLLNKVSLTTILQDEIVSTSYHILVLFCTNGGNVESLIRNLSHLMILSVRISFDINSTDPRVIDDLVKTCIGVTEHVLSNGTATPNLHGLVNTFLGVDALPIDRSISGEFMDAFMELDDSNLYMLKQSQAQGPDPGNTGGGGGAGETYDGVDGAAVDELNAGNTGGGGNVDETSDSDDDVAVGELNDQSIHKNGHKKPRVTFPPWSLPNRSRPRSTHPSSRKASSSSSGASSTHSSSFPPSVPRPTDTELSDLLDGYPLQKTNWLKYTFNHNLPNPLGAIGFRLHKQYEVGTAVMMDAYGQAGYTWFGYADFQLGDDIGKKIHVAHFTLYLKSLVQFPKLIVYARNIVCRAYLGGEGTRPWNPLDEEHTADFARGRMERDILYAPVLSNFKPVNTCMDVTGRYTKSLNASQDADGATHYESADLMCEVWGLRHSPNVTSQQMMRVTGSQPIFQTMALQEHTQVWNNGTKDLTDVIMDKGHWGHRVYPSCGKVRRGEGRCLQPVSWELTKTVSLGV